MGKLYTFESRQATTPIFDSVGVAVCKNRRTLDKGQGELDTGQYDERSQCFGASGAAPLYRRAMLKDVAIDGEYFDEDFFAYREEVDLAWRSQLLGWTCAFAPRAVGYHDRAYTPASRRRMPPFLRQHIVKNRYLLLLKNDEPAHILRHLPHILWFEASLWGHSLLLEPYLVRAIWHVKQLARRMLSKRRYTMSRRRVGHDDMLRWFV